MSDDSALPDFEDLLAAYDIPDVTVRIREATTEDGPASPDGGGGGGRERGEGGEDGEEGQGETNEGTKNASNGIDNFVTPIMNGSLKSNAVDKNSQSQGKEHVKESTSTKLDQPSEGSKEASAVEETNPTESSEYVVSKQRSNKNIIITIPAVTKADTLSVRKILSPSTSTVPGFGFKNTSTDGPKILNVSSGGMGNIVTMQKQVSGGKYKPGQVVLKHIGPASTTGPPTILRVSSVNSSSTTNPSIYKSSGGSAALCRISTLQGGGSLGKQKVVIAVNSSDSYDEEMKVLSRRQLEKSNPIETYCMTPPPDDLGIDIPTGGYKCHVCQDSYALESSLTQHMERRSVKILMKCTFCRRKLEFYNKCSMHTHLRSHNMTNINPVLDAAVSPLDILSVGGHHGGAGRPKGETKKQPGEQEPSKEMESSDNEIKSLLQQARQKFENRLNTKTASNAATSIHTPLELLAGHCPVCATSLPTKVDLAAHFQKNPGDGKQHSCSICGIVLVNKCQLKVHTKIHSVVVGRWLCPECAEVFVDYPSFKKHLSQVCYHFNRTGDFTCKLCGPKTKVQTSVAAYRVHLSTVHKNSFYKCVNCQLAFRSIEALSMHSSTQHNYKGAPLCSIISKCPLCDTVFTQNSLLISHLTSHIKTFVPVASRFICSDCPFLATSSEGLREHAADKHDYRMWWYCDICRHKFQTSTLCDTHRTKKHKEFYVYQGDPKERISDLHNGTDHVNKDRKADKSVKVDKSPGEKTANNLSGSGGDGDQKASTKVIIKRMLRCPGCKEHGVDIFFKKEINLRKHIVRSHPNMDAHTMQLDSMEYVPFYPGAKQNMKSDSGSAGATTDDVGHKRKRPGPIEPEVSAKRIKKLKEEKLSCAKCDFESKDRGVFASHIEEHRADVKTSQCQECGICFRVEDSLHKHLFVRHQIRNMKAYAEFQKEVMESIVKTQIEQAKVEKKEMDSRQERSSSKSPVNPLECKICHKVVASSARMLIHMRSHGMAYLRGKTQTVIGEMTAEK